MTCSCSDFSEEQPLPLSNRSKCGCFSASFVFKKKQTELELSVKLETDKRNMTDTHKENIMYVSVSRYAVDNYLKYVLIAKYKLQRKERHLKLHLCI